MPRTLYHLIRASGNAGTTGQSFRNHVTGAATGVRMSDYNVSGWTWDAPGQPTSLAWPYVSGTSWAMTFSFTEGSKAKLIRRTGHVLYVLDYTADDDILGEEITIMTSSVNSSDSLGSATLRLISSVPPAGHTIGYTSYDRDYGPDNWPPAGVTGVARFQITTLAPGTPRDVTYTINVRYIPDIGPYNPNLDKQFIIQATDRVLLASDLDVQWSSDGVNNDLGGGSILDIPQSFVGEDFTVYYRWKIAGSSDPYTSYAAATYTDPRLV